MAWPKSLLEKLPLGRALQWDALASSHILQTLIINYYTHTHICTHFPPPDPSPPSLWNRQPDKRVCASAGIVAAGPDGCLLELDFPPVAKSCVYGVCAFVLRCFSCSHTVLPKEHSLGVIFFLLTFLMLCCIFSSPVYLLAFHYSLYSVWLCMWPIIRNLEPWTLNLEPCKFLSVKTAQIWILVWD